MIKCFLYLLMPVLMVVVISGSHHTDAVAAGNNADECAGCGSVDEMGISRSCFPSDFMFGMGSSAYQSEGAVDEHGRGPSIWDAFTLEHPDKIADHSSGKIADEFYYLSTDDIVVLKTIGWDSFRFSISWPRIAPHGKISRGINQQGVDFYNNLIDNLLANAIQPLVTIFHWDFPQALEHEYGGFLSHRSVEDFVSYANFCFQAFGDRVKNWVTINEPNEFTIMGYDTGSWAPGRCSTYVGNCSVGNSATEPYIVAHNLLLSHAATVELYREKYQGTQKGKIGMTIQCKWMVPKYATETSRNAASRALDFQFGWFANPITYGKYPKSMRKYVGSRLPKFTKAQSEMLTRSYDFMAINYYTARYVDQPTNPLPLLNLSYTADCHCNITTEKNGIPIGLPTEVGWLYVYPKGIREVMLYVKRKYSNPIIYITENGMGTVNNESLPIEEALRDGTRIHYFEQHLSNLSKAIKDGAKVKAYYGWSFLDDFEWSAGYTNRYGVTFVDFGHGLRRYLKDSAYWFKRFLGEKPINNTRPILLSPVTHAKLLSDQ